MFHLARNEHSGPIVAILLLLLLLFCIATLEVPMTSPTLGASIHDVGKFFGFFDPPPTVTNQLIWFLLSAFW